MCNVILHYKNIFFIGDIMKNKKFGIIATIFLIVCAFALMAAVSSAPADANDDGNYTLQINTSGKWRLDLTVNGNYSSAEGVGSKTIPLNTTVNSASVTVNQYENGPTNVTLLKGKEVLEQKQSTGSGIETIYFYYDVNINK